MIMAAQYEVITLQQMHDVLTSRGYYRINVENTLEYVYERILCNDDRNYRVRIMTSVDKRTNRSRSVGSDAIRLIVLNSAGDIINGEKRVNRSTGWQVRLNARLDKWKDGIVWCDQCGGAMRPRTSKYGKFLGCSTYPMCGYTISLKGTY